MKINKKLMTGILIIVIVLIVLISAGMYIMHVEEMKPKIVVPESFKLESNESGVATYISNGTDGYKLEIKEEGNPNGVKRDDMYGSIMKCNVNGKNYVITCFMPVDKSRQVSPSGHLPYDISDIKVYPGVNMIQCSDDGITYTFQNMLNPSSNPKDLRVLDEMNKTGHLNASSIQQYFPSTFTDACKEIKERDDAYLLNRYS